MYVVGRVVWALPLAALIGCRGGGDAGSGKPQAYFKDTPAYKTQIETFKYSPEEARTLAEKHLKAMESPTYGFVGTQTIVVGDDYVFSSGPAKLGIGLDGIYMNGKTGAVHIERSPRVVRQ